MPFGPFHQMLWIKMLAEMKRNKNDVMMWVVWVMVKERDVCRAFTVALRLNTPVVGRRVGKRHGWYLR
jgi:hypothetical protein